MYVIHADAERGVGRRWRLSDVAAGRVRWVVLGLAAVMLLGLGYAKEAAVSPLVAGPVAAAPGTVTVQPGETLWGIATRRYPGADVRQKVYEIERLNDLGGPTIVAGQRLRVPER